MALDFLDDLRHGATQDDSIKLNAPGVRVDPGLLVRGRQGNNVTAAPGMPVYVPVLVHEIDDRPGLVFSDILGPNNQPQGAPPIIAYHGRNTIHLAPADKPYVTEPMSNITIIWSGDPWRVWVVDSNEAPSMVVEKLSWERAYYIVWKQVILEGSPSPDPDPDPDPGLAIVLYSWQGAAPLTVTARDENQVTGAALREWELVGPDGFRKLTQAAPGELEATWTLTTPGPYSLTLRLFDAEGLISQVTDNRIVVQDPGLPQVKIRIDNPRGIMPHSPILVDDSDLAGVEFREWTLRNLTAGGILEFAAEHAELPIEITAPGVYSVTLRIVLMSGEVLKKESAQRIDVLHNLPDVIGQSEYVARGPNADRRATLPETDLLTRPPQDLETPGYARLSLTIAGLEAAIETAKQKGAVRIDVFWPAKIMSDSYFEFLEDTRDE